MTEILSLQAMSLISLGAFSVAFAIIGAQSRYLRHARWFAAAYAFGTLSLGISFFVPQTLVYSGADMARVVTAFIACLCGIMGLSLRMGFKVSAKSIALRSLILFVPAIGILLLDAPYALKATAFQAPLALLLVPMGMRFIKRTQDRQRDTRDRVFGWTLLAVAAGFACQPLLAITAQAWGQISAEHFITSYDLTWRFCAALAGVSLGILLLLGFVRDMVWRAQHDMSTRLLNRSAFEDAVADAMAQAERRGSNMALITADLDRFKQVNDRFGHAAGDDMIAHFSSLLRQVTAVNAQAIAGRIGGEEFALFIPGAETIAAQVIAEGIRSGLKLARFEWSGDEVFSASFGVAARRKCEPFNELQRRADQALYVAKRNGRDRVVMCLGKTREEEKYIISDLGRPQVTPQRARLALVRAS